MNNSLGDLCIFIRNGKPIQQSNTASGLPITRIETISQGFIDPARVGYANVSLADAEAYLLEPGDILFSHINSVEHLGKVAIFEGSPTNLVHGMNLLCLRPKRDLVAPRFLYHYLGTPRFKKQLAKLIKPAVNQASITTSDLKTTAILLPPLAEQRRIAIILDKVDELCGKRQQALALLDDLVKSVFLQMFGDPRTNDRGWTSLPLREIALVLYGKSLKATSRVNGEIPVYGANGIVGFHNESLVEQPTVIIGRKGSAGEVNYAEQGGWPIDTTFYLQILDQDRLSMQFVYFLLKWLDLREKLLQHQSQGSTGMKSTKPT